VPELIARASRTASEKGWEELGNRTGECHVVEVFRRAGTDNGRTAMNVLKSAGIAAALLLGAPSPSPAQSAADSASQAERLGPVGRIDPTTPRAAKSNGPVTMTEGEVKKKLEKQGYEHVREIEAKEGGFTARAMKQGRTRTVSIDKFGRVAVVQ
jgi:hypothetical protein